MGSKFRGQAARIKRYAVGRVRMAERVGHRTLLRYPKRVACPVCGWSGPILGASQKPRRTNRICPQCRSSERYRALELLLAERGRVAPGTRLLEVAPIDTVRGSAERLGYDYASVDLSSRRARVLGDLTRLPFPDASFDVVVCFHVLEHIPDDVEAVRELARVVGPEGEAIIVVPYGRKLAETFEVPDADPADYERLYGQSDHVRIYGTDLLARWEPAQVAVTEVPWDDLFSTEVQREHALPGDDDRFMMIRSA